MKRTADINKVLKPLDETETQSVLTNVLQVADVLDWILKQVGKSKIWQTSFSISEEFLRRLYFIEKSGNVSEFNLVLDHKATNKTLKLWVFLDNVIRNTYLADNHSKVLLVESESGRKVCVITSQNLTRGNRNESYLITTSESVFCSLKTNIEDLIRNHSVTLNEILGERLGDD